MPSSILVFLLLAFTAWAAPSGAQTNGSERARSIEVAPDFCAPADVNGSTDNTACLQAALTAAARAGGARVHLRGSYVVDRLRWDDNFNGVWLEGESSENGGASRIACAAGSGDCISIGTLVGGGIARLLITADKRSGGFAIAINGGQRFHLDEVYVDHSFNCLSYRHINGDSVNRVICNDVRGGECVLIAGDKDSRSDILNLTDTACQGHTTNGAGASAMVGLHMIGAVNTIVTKGFRVISANYGMIAEASADGSMPFGGDFTDFESDFSTHECIRIMAGEEWQFAQSYCNGARTTDDLVTFGPKASELMMQTTKLLSANGALVHISGQGATLVGNYLGVWCRTDKAAGAIRLDGEARTVAITGNIMGKIPPFGASNCPMLQARDGADGVAFVGNVGRGTSGVLSGSLGPNSSNTGNVSYR